MAPCVGVPAAPAKAGAKCWSELHGVSVSAGKKKFRAAFGLWKLQIGPGCEAVAALWKCWGFHSLVKAQSQYVCDCSDTVV